MCKGFCTLYYKQHIQAVVDLCNVRANRILRKSNMTTDISNCISNTVNFDWNSDSDTLESHRPQHNRHAACVIAQQCSSTTLISLCFNPAKKNSARGLKMLCQCFYFFKIAWVWNCATWNYVSRGVFVTQGKTVTVLLPIFTDNIYDLQ